MNDLNALFDSVDGLKEDLMEYGTIAAGAIGANVLWNLAVAKFVPPTLDPTLRKWGLPTAAILVGIAGGRVVARRNRKLGLGFTIGLVSAGLTQFAKTLVPNLPVAGISGDEEYYGVAGMALNGAPMAVEDHGMGALQIEEAGVHGVPMAVEEMSGFEAAIS